MFSFEILLSIISPILGGIIGIIKKPKEYIIYHLLAFAGGIMLCVSFLEIIPESIHYSNLYICILGIILGFFTMSLIDLLLPKNNSLKETAIIIVIGMGFHNFAEGMAIAITSNLNKSINFIVTSSIFIHNIAEGICTALPYYYISKSKLKSFLITSFTAIPLFLGYVFIQIVVVNNISHNFLSFILGSTAGLMINITVCNLIPESCHKITGYLTEISFIIGIIIVMLLQ